MPSLHKAVDVNTVTSLSGQALSSTKEIENKFSERYWFEIAPDASTHVPKDGWLDWKFLDSTYGIDSFFLRSFKHSNLERIVCSRWRLRYP